MAFQVGDKIKIKAEFQDAGDDAFSWVVVGAEEKGRVDISAQAGEPFAAVQTVEAHMIEAA